MHGSEGDEGTGLRATLETLDLIESQIEVLRPRNPQRERMIVLLFLAVVIAAGVAFSFNPTVWTASGFGIGALYALARWFGLMSRNGTLKGLELERDLLLETVNRRKGGADLSAHPTTADALRLPAEE